MRILIVADVSPRLPIEAKITSVALMAHDDEGRWVQHSAYPLG